MMTQCSVCGTMVDDAAGVCPACGNIITPAANPNVAPNNGQMNETRDPYAEYLNTNTTSMNNNYYDPNQQNEPAKPPVTDVLSMIFGIVGILFSCCSLPGLIFAIIAIVMGAKNAKNPNATAKSKIGLITGIVGAVLALIAGIVGAIMAGTGYLGVLLDKSGSSTDTTPIYVEDDNWDYDIEDYSEYDDYNYDTDDYPEYDGDDSALVPGSGDDSSSGAGVSGNYVPEYNVKVIGNDELGYTYVPATYPEFTDVNGYSEPLHMQYGIYKDIVGLYATDVDDPYDAETYAKARAYTIDNGLWEGCDSESGVYSTENVNGIQGYLIKCHFTADNVDYYEYLYDGDDGRVHRISVEFVVGAGEDDLWKTVLLNYTKDGSVTGLPE